MTLIRTTMTAAAAALVLATTGAARADHHDKDKAAAMLKEADTNADQRLSPDEHAAASKKMFTAMDTDADGKVTTAEMEGFCTRTEGKQAKSKMTAEEKIRVIDANGDGVLTSDEHANGSKAMFSRLDTDGDNQLTKSELAAGHAKLLNRKAP